MLIDLEREQLYPLRVAVKWAPPSSRTGKTLHPSVLFRWVKRGLVAADGSRVYLEAVKAGSALAISREALERFFGELTRRAGLPRSSAVSPSCSLPSPPRRNDLSAIERELDASGI
jgi:hypothetical protein